MVAPPDDRAARWLSLVAALYLALVPMNGLVVCHDPDGAANLELAAADQRCTGCDEHAPAHHPSRHAPSCSDHRECPCVDAVVTPDHDAAGAPPAKQGASAPLVALAPVAIAPPLLAIDAASGRCEAPRPRPPPGILLIRSVVLVL
jgi:hypothetical protein